MKVSRKGRLFLISALIILGLQTLRLALLAIRDPTGLIISLAGFAVIILAILASWPFYSSRRNRWIRDQTTRAVGTVVIPAVAAKGDFEPGQSGQVWFFLVGLPDSLEFSRAWTLWRRPPELFERVPWSSVTGLEVGDVPIPIGLVQGLTIRRSVGPDIRLHITGLGFIDTKADPNPTFRALWALRAAAPAPPSAAQVERLLEASSS